MYQLCKRKVVCFHKTFHAFGGFGENLILIVSLVCFQGQFRDSSGADQVQAGAGRLPGQFEEGADEGGLSRAHAGAKGQSDLLNNRVLGCKGNVKSLKNISNCFTEQRDRGVDKDLRRADRQDGEELAAAPHPGQISQEEGLWKSFLKNEVDQ